MLFAGGDVILFAGGDVMLFGGVVALFAVWLFAGVVALLVGVVALLAGVVALLVGAVVLLADALFVTQLLLFAGCSSPSGSVQPTAPTSNATALNFQYFIFSLLTWATRAENLDRENHVSKRCVILQ